MTLPCDIRLAAAGAKLGLTFTKMGILPGLGSTYLLPRLVGAAKAQELVLTAKIMLAEEAADIGLVNRVVSPQDLMSQARELAKGMADCNPEVLAAAKSLLYAGEADAVTAAMAREQQASTALRT